MECVQERLHLPYVFKNALQRANWKDKSAKWSHLGSGSPTWGFRAKQRLIPLEKPHCPHWAVLFLSPKLSVSFLLFLFIWFLQSLPRITTQILFSCMWFLPSPLSQLSVMKCYGQCCPGMVQLWKRHHLITLHLFCWQHVKGRRARVWHSIGWDLCLGSTGKCFFGSCKAIYCSVQFCNSWQLTINVWSHSVVIPRPSVLTFL